MTRVKGDLLEGGSIKEWDADGLLRLCDLMYKCETSFAAWGKLELLNSDEVIQGLFQRLPYRIKTQFVSVSNKGNEECLFQRLRELVEIAASDAETPLGKLLQKKPVKSGTSPAS